MKPGASPEPLPVNRCHTAIYLVLVRTRRLKAWRFLTRPTLVRWIRHEGHKAPPNEGPDSEDAEKAKRSVEKLLGTANRAVRLVRTRPTNR